ncbi:hypothetical protein QP868_02075 [Brevibacterium sp. UMB1308A]|uniref:hypothetical protein n=1 Tax=Brevibacterium sp. UMB1308A TaxID=3050608 RepID=UPI00254EB3AA|nr:hypothetical protein [Brevibacterium sp. UMB1308A]MDK8345470.1 hypothetical protein [Brevibacterium sp. UMB1308B]MDK8712685.1 hypothetical protein [Brevibacterium sp. UMB1308A]
MTTGVELKQLGADLVIASDEARANASEHIRATIEHLAGLGQAFTAEDVREELRAMPHVFLAMRDRPNLLPAHFTAAKRRGDIVPVGFTVPTRASRHGSVIRVWRRA